MKKNNENLKNKNKLSNIYPNTNQSKIINNNSSKFEAMMEYCFEIFYNNKKKQMRNKTKSLPILLNKQNEEHNEISKNFTLDDKRKHQKLTEYELLKNIKNLVNRRESKFNLKNQSDDKFFTEENEQKQITNPSGKININKQCISELDSNLLYKSSTNKVNSLFLAYFKNNDPDSEEIKEVNDELFEKRMKKQHVILTSKYFNRTCEKFKPKIFDLSKTLMKKKYFIIKGISKTIAPCKIPADYIERRKLFMNILQNNQKIIKGYYLIPKREVKLITIKEITDQINKLTDELHERIYLCYHYLSTYMKFNPFQDLTEFHSLYKEINNINSGIISHKANLKGNINPMNKTGFSTQGNINVSDKNKFNKTFNNTNTKDRKQLIEELEKIAGNEHIYKLGTTYFIGFVNLFIEMLINSGVPQENIIRIQGFYKPLLSQEEKRIIKTDFLNALPNHEWIRIKIYDNWYFIDPSFSTGFFNNEGQYIEEFNPFYFFVPSNVIIDSHLPLKEDNQYLLNTIKPTEFINTQPIDYRRFYESYFKYNFIPIQPYTPYMTTQPSSSSTIIFELPYIISFELYDIENVKMTIEKHVNFIRSGNSYTVEVFNLELIGIYTLFFKAQTDPKNVNLKVELFKFIIVVSN